MAIYFSKLNRGFYDTEIVGERTVLTVDPDWSGEGDPAFVEIENEHCRLPADALALSAEVHAALLQAQAEGKVLDWSGDAPAAVDRAPEWADVQAAAKRELEANDQVYMRCAKAGVPYPVDWSTYDQGLRAIVRTESGDPDAALPPRPVYPAGT